MKNFAVKGIIEKPVYIHSVSAGIYVLDKNFKRNLKKKKNRYARLLTKINQSK